jgi:hypothetical protein
LHAALSPLILDIGPPADPPINLVTAKKKVEKRYYGVLSNNLFRLWGEKILSVRSMAFRRALK